MPFQVVSNAGFCSVGIGHVKVKLDILFSQNLLLIKSSPSPSQKVSKIPFSIMPFAIKRIADSKCHPTLFKSSSSVTVHSLLCKIKFLML